MLFTAYSFHAYPLGRYKHSLLLVAICFGDSVRGSYKTV